MAAAAMNAEPTGWANEVHLVGRVSGPPEERTLPSGDVVVLFRLVVPRPAAGRRTATARGAAKGPAVDTIDVACWSSRPRRAALRLGDGDTADVSGALHRRFYRAGGTAASRYEVAATTVTRIRPSR
jgi:single-strand DNA-binding protein